MAAVLVSAKLAPCFPYPVLVEFWRAADDLGFHAIWTYDHFYGLVDPAGFTLEGWTTLAALAATTNRARVGCMVTGVTYRHPAVLANMAVSVDHISGGRLEFGIGAAWHELEHRGYGIAFPPAATRIEMLDEALEVIKRLWTEKAPSYRGRHWRLEEARCEPKPLQRPRPPIVIGASRPRMLELAARHADEWNSPAVGPEEWAEQRAALDAACASLGRDPKEIRRSVQLFLHPQQEGQIESVLDRLPAYAEAGCDHVVLSFYQPPSRAQLERCARIA